MGGPKRERAFVCVDAMVLLEEADLDDEDRAILKEVSKRGYYHGRPKSEATAAPERIVAAAPTPIKVEEQCRRRDFDDFQKKWDKFDSEQYLSSVERDLKATQ